MLYPKQISMIPKKAIEKAIEGGWKGLFMDDEGITVDTQSQIAWGRTKTGLGRHLPLQVIALDPTFWQALGRAKHPVCKDCGGDIEMIATGEIRRNGDGVIQ